MEKTKKQRRRHEQSYWEQIVAEQETSRQQAKEFCRDRDIGLASFYAWRRRLRGGVSGKSHPDNVGFVELRRKADVGDASIVVRCGEFVVEIHGGFDDVILRRVLCTVRNASTAAKNNGDS